MTTPELPIGPGDLPPTAPATPADPAPEVGSRAHIRQATVRARAARAEADRRAARRAADLGRAESAAARAERAATGSAALRAHLRTSLAAYVRRLRAEGAPPERMLVLVKTALREDVAPHLNRDEAAAVAADAVRWSIEAYYEPA